MSPEQLIAHCEDFAKDALLKNGSLKPFVVGLANEGKRYYYDFHIGDDEDKERAFNGLRMLMAADNIQYYVVAHECWLRLQSVRHGEKLDLSKIDPKVSQHPERKEAISVNYCRRLPPEIKMIDGKPTSVVDFERRMKTILFYRAKDNSISTFEEIGIGNGSGTFFTFMAPKFLGDAEIEVAKTVTKMPQFEEIYGRLITRTELPAM